MNNNVWAIALGLTAVTLLLALGVKQISYALHSGSLFEGLRGWINNKSRAGWFGMTTLNELFTCKLCITMQVSVWTVFGPSFTAFLILTELGLWINVLAFVLGFVLSMGVSGIAQAMWVRLEYPEKRYRELELKFKLLKAQQGKPAERREGVLTIAQILEIYTEEDAARLHEVLKECARIGCGYSRRECRVNGVYEHVQAWVQSAGLSRHEVQTLNSHLERIARKFRKDQIRRLSPESFYAEVSTMKIAA